MTDEEIGREIMDAYDKTIGFAEAYAAMTRRARELLAPQPLAAPTDSRINKAFERATNP